MAYNGSRAFRAQSSTPPHANHWYAEAYAQCIGYEITLGDKGYLSGASGERFLSHPSTAAGLAIGYSLKAARRLCFDFYIGVGYATGSYQTYRHTDGHNVWQSTGHLHWVGPTRAGVAVSWLFGKGGGL